MIGTMLALGLALGGAVVNAVGQVKAGNAAKAAGRAQQDVANSQADLSDANASLADQQAADAVARGSEEENRFRTQVRDMIGTQRSQFAASGVDVGFGSAVDTPADAARLGELDALTIRSNAAREAWGYQVQAFNDRQQAIIQRKEGVNAVAAAGQQAAGAYAGAAGTLLTSTGSLFLQKYGKK